MRRMTAFDDDDIKESSKPSSNNKPVMPARGRVGIMTIFVIVLVVAMAIGMISCTYTFGKGCGNCMTCGSANCGSSKGCCGGSSKGCCGGKSSGCGSNNSGCGGNRGCK